MSLTTWKLRIVFISSAQFLQLRSTETNKNCVWETQRKRDKRISVERDFQINTCLFSIDEELSEQIIRFKTLRIPSEK